MRMLASLLATAALVGPLRDQEAPLLRQDQRPAAPVRRADF